MAAWHSKEKKAQITIPTWLVSRSGFRILRTLKVGRTERTPWELARRAATAKVAWADLGYVGIRLPLFLISLLVPSRWDDRAVNLLWRAARIVGPHSKRNLAAIVRKRASDRLSISPELCEVEQAKRNFENYWGKFRAMRGQGWRVEIRWEGEEHLIQALNQGKGVVLWFFSFCDNVIMLRALAEKGYRVVHLSRIQHGAPSKSIVGMGLLAGWVRTAENRLLEDRVIMGRGVTPATMNRLEQALAKNCCVTIRGDQSAPPGIEATLFGQRVVLAPGAPSLAWKTGAPLLTIGLRRIGFGEYAVCVEPPIPIDRSLDRKTAVRSACLVFAARLQKRIEQSPADWTGWRHPRLWVDDPSAAQ